MSEILFPMKSKLLLSKKMQASFKNLPASVAHPSVNSFDYFLPIEAFLPHMVHLPSFTTAVSLATAMH